MGKFTDRWREKYYDKCSELNLLGKEVIRLREALDCISKYDDGYGCDTPTIAKEALDDVDKDSK